MLSDDELLQIINQGESDRVEFTESSGDLNSDDLNKIRKAICAFANNLPNHSAPGLIFIGLADDGSGAGLPIDDKLLQKLGGLRCDGKILPFPVMTVDKRNLCGGAVAVIQVEPSENPPVKVGGRCWIRTGPRRAQATAEEERRLTEKRRWGNLPYDMQGVNGASIENDLDMLRFTREYLPTAVSADVLEENARDREDQLKALRFMAKNGDPTVTAILILGQNPTDWFPGAYIQFVRFAGTETTDHILDKKEIHGTLPDQLIELDKIFKINISVALDTSGETHMEKPDYPFEALRELARNAVIHRNYEATNTPVRICWLGDRVEIISPGSVYGEVTAENFGKPGSTAYRNPTIAEAMKNLGFMQRFGIGIATADNALQRNDNPPADFKIEDTFIHVTLRPARSRGINENHNFF